MFRTWKGTLKPRRGESTIARARKPLVPGAGTDWKPLVGDRANTAYSVAREGLISCLRVRNEGLASLRSTAPSLSFHRLCEAYPPQPVIPGKSRQRQGPRNPALAGIANPGSRSKRGRYRLHLDRPLTRALPKPSGFRARLCRPGMTASSR